MWKGGCRRESGGGREGGRVWEGGLVNICDYVQAQLN